jgi:uncharacterized protein (TIGR03437 family)
MCSVLAGALFAGTFGTVVTIGGQASDLALDEARGVVYVANYTAGRVDVVSTATKRIKTTISVAAYPSGIALSPNGQYLVLTHMASFAAPLTPAMGVTVLRLDAQGSVTGKQTYTFGSAPLGVAFGGDGLALIPTATDFLLLDPATGSTRTLDTMDNVIELMELPPSDNGVITPRNVVNASLATSGDWGTVWGLIGLQAATAGANNSQDATVLIRYDVGQKDVHQAGHISTPVMGPRVVSTNRTGSRVLGGWSLSHLLGYQLAQFPDALGNVSVGSHAIDSDRALVYAEVPTSSWTPTTPPVLQVLDADNLAVREQIKLQENLAGRSQLTADGSVMYSVSDSGLYILPVGRLDQSPRVAATQEDLLYRGNWCNSGGMSQPLSIVDPGGNHTAFSLSTDMAGVTFSPSSGTTPATVTVTIDTNAFKGSQGTSSGEITINSAAAVNIPPKVRVLINNREPDQRGTIVNVPGKLVDIAADPERNRIYVLRQDKNQVLVFDASNYRQIATMRTGNTPWSMAITADHKYLITGADNSQVASVFNLDTMQFRNYIVFPGGHYPRWIAASNKAVLASTRVAGPKHKIDQIQVASGFATELPSLGIWENNINIDTALSASPTGGSILIAEADGKVMLYDANVDRFIVQRQDVDALSGAFAALSDDIFVADNRVLNGSLVTEQTLETGSGLTSGFAMADGMGLRTTAPDPASPGVISRVDFENGAIVRPTRIVEAPVLVPTGGAGFVRSLAPLPSGTSIAVLTTSGFAVLPAAYDAAVADPHIDSIVSAADGSSAVAPGGLFTVLGSNLNPTNIATNEMPLPTALGDSCMTINGTLVPLVFVSPSQINGQIPYSLTGDATMILRTPAGVSNNFDFTIDANAPAIFLTSVQGWDGLTATVMRAGNNEIVTPTNPLHPSDRFVIYLTGLGVLTPEVKDGYPGPSNPLAAATAQPTVALGGVQLNVSFAGLAPGAAGVYEIDAQLPTKGIPTGMSVPLTVSQGDAQTTVHVRVVKP